MLEAALAVLSSIADMANIASLYTSIKSGTLAKKVLTNKGDFPDVQKLDENIYSIPEKEITKINDKGEIKKNKEEVIEIIKPFQKSVGGDIITTEVIATKKPVNNITEKSLGNLLMDVKPISERSYKYDHSMMPIIFNTSSGLKYGWQSIEALPHILRIDYNPIINNNGTINRTKNYEYGFSKLDGDAEYEDVVSIYGTPGSSYKNRRDIFLYYSQNKLLFELHNKNRTNINGPKTLLRIEIESQQAADYMFQISGDSRVNLFNKHSFQIINKFRNNNHPLGNYYLVNYNNYTLKYDFDPINLKCHKITVTWH